MNKSLILCADDFAQNEAVSRGIVQLLEASRLTAVGCMTDSPRWKQDAPLLLPYVDLADVGLHFNLTHPFAEQVWPLAALMTASWRHNIDAQQIRASLARQLDRFESALGRAPDYLDGHQHVHAFPWIRDIVHEVLLVRYPEKRPYLRSVSKGTLRGDAPLKALVLRMLARNADRAAAKAGFRLTKGFDGLYSLTAGADYGRHMQMWLERARDGTLLMCHPGLRSDDADDPSAAARPNELAYLLSDAFQQALDKAGVSLARFRPA